MRLPKTLIFIQSILDDPNPECCLNEKAGNLYYMDRKKYEETAREFTLKYGNFRTFENQLKERGILDSKISVRVAREEEKEIVRNLLEKYQ